MYIVWAQFVHHMKFLWSNLWVGGLSTDDTNAKTNANDDARQHIIHVPTQALFHLDQMIQKEQGIYILIYF